MLHPKWQTGSLSGTSHSSSRGEKKKNTQINFIIIVIETSSTLFLSVLYAFSPLYINHHISLHEGYNFQCSRWHTVPIQTQDNPAHKVTALHNLFQGNTCTEIFNFMHGHKVIHFLTFGGPCIVTPSYINPYPMAFPYGNGMVLHFYQQQESSTTKTVHRVINKRLKAYV